MICINRIRILRDGFRESQTQLADRLGVSQATLSNWERGVHDPDNDMLIEIANHFGVSIDYLLCKEEGGPSFVNRIRALRHAAGLSQRALSEAIHVHQTAVSQWETEKTNPDVAQAARLAGFFDVSVDYLLGRTGDPRAQAGETRDAAECLTALLRARLGRSPTEHELTWAARLLDAFADGLKERAAE